MNRLLELLTPMRPFGLREVPLFVVQATRRSGGRTAATTS